MSNSRRHEFYKDVESGVRHAQRVRCLEDKMTSRIRTRASYPTLLLVSMPRLPIQMAWAAQWAAMDPLLSTMLPPLAASLIKVIGPITGILIAPTIGVLSDDSTHSWGRRAPFLVYGAIATALCWTLMGFTREMGQAMGDYGSGGKDANGEDIPTERFWTALFTVFFYTWMDIAVNCMQTPAHLLISDFAGDRQTTGASLGQAWSCVGAIIVAVYIQWFGPAHESLVTFLCMLSAVTVLVIAFVCYFVDELPLDTEDYFESAAGSIFQAFGSVYEGIVTLPRQLIVYWTMMALVLYGSSVFVDAKGNFFALEIFKGKEQGAWSCKDDCTIEQQHFLDGQHLAGKLTDLIGNGVTIVYLLILPFLVKECGAKGVLTFAIIPQCLFAIMAFINNVQASVVIVLLTVITSNTLLSLYVPIIVHIMGEHADIGMYVGAFNTAICFGQLINFFVRATMLNTTLGYILPIFVGGICSILAFFINFFLRLEMFSL